MVSSGAVTGAVGLLDGLDLNVMFEAALGLAVPWQKVSVQFDPEAVGLILGWTSRGLAVRVPPAGLRQTSCASRRQDLAASGLLRASGVSGCAGAAGPVR